MKKWREGAYDSILLGLIMFLFMVLGVLFVRFYYVCH